MFWLRKQQQHSVTLKLAVAAFLSLLASFPEPTAAAIIRVVTEPISTSNLENSDYSLNVADLFGLAFETDVSKLTGSGRVLLAGNPSASPSGDRPRDPLSLESLIDSLKRLQLNGSGKQNESTPPVPILKQVDMANIYEGVYIFTPKNPRKTDSPVKQNQAPGESANSPSGPFTGIYLPRLGGPPAVVSFPQSLGLSVSSLPVSNTYFRSENLLDPKKELAAMPIDGERRLSDFLKTLDRFGGLGINVNLSLQPKTAMANPRRLEPYYALPSSLQGGGAGKTLAMANQIQRQMQQEVAKNSQQLQREQDELQRQIKQQMREQQKEQEKLRREEQKRLVEQEKQLREQYRQQQQQLKEQYRQQQQQLKEPYRN